MSDPFEDPGVQAFLARANRELLPKIKASSLSIGLWSGDPDPKQALEMGYSLLLDKPIVIVVMHNAKVPEKVVKIADAIIEWSDDQSVLATRINETLEAILGDDDEAP